MNSTPDPRIPILLSGEPTQTDATLVEDGNDMPTSGYAHRFALAATLSHPAGCACCSLRGPAADALTAMFQARATGRAPFFTRIVIRASPAGQAAVQDALESDVVTRSRFRLHNSNP